MDVMLACRCCLLCPPDKDLTTPHTHLDKTEIYADMIKECFDIQLQLAVGGSGSSGICCTCVGRLRDASDFKLQVQRSQAELQARSQGASLVKEEESAVECENPEMQDTHETCGSEPGEETAVKPEMLDEDTPEEILYEEFTVKSEASAEDDEISLCSDGSARAREQLAMACSVVLERLRGDATAHSGAKPIACEHCGERFRNETILNRHIQDTHLPSAPKQFSCDFCSSTFQTESLILEHEKIEHGVTNFMCAHCDYSTMSKKCLAVHLKNQCSFKNLIKSDLHKQQAILSVDKKTHKTTHMKLNTRVEPYKCSYCDYKCGNRSHLRTHIITHTGEKPFQCRDCAYKCARRSQLQRHMRTHTGEKPYACGHCEYRCSRKSTLRTHVMRHTGDKPFHCSHCAHKCRSKSDLQSHQRIHTGEKPYACSHCEYRYSYRSSLKAHVMTHTGEKPFLCSYCVYKCSTKSDLQKHQRIHTGEKHYACSHCDYKFSNKSNLRRHQKTHIGMNPDNAAMT
ncbi:oocyte zinc finger protein XlCOF6-like isoform X1 [Leguminivora glycinivorella]|uniref:oocyte zinc finger protein XlCOF6-like isoform X1 n=1 Tax=Leguminivora glycinivorella TaxID=1035111 RepID=UPI00200D570E|nr:oocyte zinc finger protein XlCOF6-like isoform X1 [Leguminivora glycinivorella]